MAWASFTLDTLIDNWGKQYAFSTSANKGSYDDAGMYQQATDVWKEGFGVIAIMVNEMLTPAELGAYTSQDMYLITGENHQEGTFIRDMEREYKIHERADYTPFDQTYLFVYKMKREGRLDESNSKVLGDSESDKFLLPE